MLKEILSLIDHNNKPGNKPKDTNYASAGSLNAISLGAKTIGGTRGKGYSNGGTFDYLSNAENTIECYYQKLEDLRYYESHALTEKIIGLFRDYINQLWKEGSNIIDIPGMDEDKVKLINKELQGMDVLEVITKDLNDVIFYGSVSYEISGVDAVDLDELKKKKVDTLDQKVRNIDFTKNKPKDRKYDLGDTKVEPFELNKSYYTEIDKNFAETKKQKANRLIESTSPEVQDLIKSTSPMDLKGEEKVKNYKKSEKREKFLKVSPLVEKEGASEESDFINSVRDFEDYKPTLKINKLKFPHHTIVEHHRKEGRRYLVKANTKYHIPTNKHSIFYYGNDSMKIVEEDNIRVRNKGNAKSNISDLIGHKESKDNLDKEMKDLGINPKDPKKKPTRYQLMERELSAAVPLFYQHLPKVRELYLKDLVVSILGIKDVIQPDILGMNFEGGMDIDQAQEMCQNLEDLLNKNSDYSIFNSSSLDYNDLVKLIVDTVRILPDVDGKLQGLNPIRTTSLQEKIQQIRMESKELERDVTSSLGVPVDLFEGNSSKWEVIKRSERLQSRVTYYINMIKVSLRRLAQSVYFHLYEKELRINEFKITLFSESDIEIAQKTNKLQSLVELSQTLIQLVTGAERELQDSTLINKEKYFKLLKSNLKDIYPEMEDLLDVDGALDQQQGGEEQGQYDQY
jgi:hypothetical protein